MSSKLYAKLRESLGWVYDIHSAYFAYAQAGVLIIEGTALPEMVNQTILTIIQELERIAADGITEEDLARRKMQMIGQHQLSSDSMHTRMSRLLTQRFYFERHIKDSEMIDELSSISCESIQTEAQHLLQPNSFGLVVTGDAACEKQLRDCICDSSAALSV